MATLQQIDAALSAQESEQSRRVLYACESGSRAWGFPSPDSDYDVRFVYVMPLSFYLTVEPGRDTHEMMLPDALDLSGWEVRKTLRLFAACNLALCEWLGSPIVYRTTPWVDRLRGLMPQFFNPRKAMHHYLSSARSTETSHLSGDSLRIKKFFYVLRPLLAARFIERTLAMPPTAFAPLYQADDMAAPLRAQIDDIVAQKRNADEATPIRLGPDLLAFLQQEQLRLQQVEVTLPGAPRADHAVLDDLLQSCILGSRRPC